jgi:hypothetical protein
VTVQNEKIAAALETIRHAVRNARAAEDVVTDRRAVKTLDEIEAQTNRVAQTIERLERELTTSEYSVASQEIAALYRQFGNLQAVAAIRGPRNGGYKGSASTNANRSLSLERREQIKVDFERARLTGTPKEEIYRQLAHRYKSSDRTIRRAVSGRR